MACLLHARGRTFDAAGCSALLAVDSDPWHAKEKGVFGLSVEISSRSFDEAEGQVSDARVFVERQHGVLEAVSKYPGVEEVWVEFGVRRDASGGAQVRHLPADLCKALGGLGIAVVITEYPPAAEACGTDSGGERSD